MAALVAASPADAKKKKPAVDDKPIVDVDTGQPMILVVSTGHQKIDIYRGTKLITSSSVSTGTAAYPTKIGAFSILEKKRYHHSNLYSNAPMPWMNRITWSGTALHAGVVPGYPASHGCIRLLYSFAPKLFQMTSVGDNVVVSKGRPAPVPVSHPFLFQPTPLSKVAEQTLPLRTDGVPLPARAAAAASLIVRAKADLEPPAEGDVKVETVAAVAPAEENQAPSSQGATHARPDIAPDPYRTHAVTVDTGSEMKAAAEAKPADEPESATADKPAKEELATKETPSPAPAKDAQPAQPIGAAATKVDAGVRAAASEAASPDAVIKVDAGVNAAAIEAASSETLAKVEAGTLAASIQAAEPRSDAPLRILFTRRTKRDRMIAVQQTLADLGYLDHQNFDGTLGRTTVKALKSFQKDNGMAESGAFDEELVKKVYEKAGKSEAAAGHLFVRQAYVSLFDLPVNFRDPDQPLGTHVYTALRFGPEDTKAEWVTIDVQDDQGPHPLDRLEIPDDVRQKISERLTPGSTFIVADTAINSAGLTKGNDFVVLAKATQSFKISDASEERPQVKKKRRSRSYSRTYRDNYSSYRGRANRPFFFQGRGAGAWRSW